jgi:BON domain
MADRENDTERRFDRDRGFERERGWDDPSRGRFGNQGQGGGQRGFGGGQGWANRGETEAWRERETQGGSVGTYGGDREGSYGTSGGYGGYGNPGVDMGTYGGGMGTYGQTGRQTGWREREYQGGGVGSTGGYSNPSGGDMRQGYSGGMGNYGQTGPHTGRGPKGWHRSDERILEDINERLTQHPNIDAFEIEIEVKNGEVVLRGSVGNRHEKRMAEDVAENVSGVRDVRNELRVQSHEHAGAGSSTAGSHSAATGSSGSSSSGSSPGSPGTSGSSRKS